MKHKNYFSDLRVDEYTTPSPLFVLPSDNVKKVKKMLLENNFRHMLVVNNKKIVGVLSDRDIRLVESCSPSLENITVEAVMIKDPYVVAPDTPLQEVVYYMSKEKIGSAIVQSEEDDYIGIFTSTDALNALLEVLRGDLNE